MTRYLLLFLSYYPDFFFFSCLTQMTQEYETIEMKQSHEERRHILIHLREMSETGPCTVRYGGCICSLGLCVTEAHTPCQSFVSMAWGGLAQR